jgi:hypothetical protein
MQVKLRHRQSINLTFHIRKRSKAFFPLGQNNQLVVLAGLIVTKICKVKVQQS